MLTYMQHFPLFLHSVGSYVHAYENNEIKNKEMTSGLVKNPVNWLFIVEKSATVTF